MLILPPGAGSAAGQGPRLTNRRAQATLTAVTGTPDHVLRNRSAWDRWAAGYAGPGLLNWTAEPRWGIWGIADEQVGVLPAALEGRDSIELGCGTGYVSAWLARRGARPVGLDNSSAQLATAAGMQDQFGLRFPLVQASAERVPFSDASFDLAISEYGASIWCDPYTWIPEAARLLRPGGRLIFLVNSVVLMLTVPEQDGLPATEQLLRPYFGMHRFEWPDDESVEFHLGHGDMIRLLRLCQLEVEDLLELRPPPAATASHPLATIDWARQWPCEEVWKARKLG
jgi:SAM-dependent methyltransferase